MEDCFLQTAAQEDEQHWSVWACLGDDPVDSRTGEEEDFGVADPGSIRAAVGLADGRAGRVGLLGASGQAGRRGREIV